MSPFLLLLHFAGLSWTQLDENGALLVAGDESEHHWDRGSNWLFHAEFHVKVLQECPHIPILLFYSAHDSIISIFKSEVCDITRSCSSFFFLNVCFFLFLCVWGCLSQVSREEFPIKVFADQPGPEPHSTAWPGPNVRLLQGLKQIEATNVIFQCIFHAFWILFRGVFFQVSDAIRFHFYCHLYFHLIYLDISDNISCMLCSVGSRVGSLFCRWTGC